MQGGVSDGCRGGVSGCRVESVMGAGVELVGAGWSQ